MIPVAKLKQSGLSKDLYRTTIVYYNYVVHNGLAMKIVGYNMESLSRHGITSEMIDEVLAGSMISYFPIDDAEDTCEMLVGYTFTEKLIEVGLRYKTPDAVFVFHAQTVSPQYRKLFEEDWKNG